VGNLQWVDCTLPGYEGVRVGIRVDNDWLLVNGQPLARDERDTDRLYAVKRAAAIAPLWAGTWDFVHPLTGEPLQRPDWNDLYTYLELSLHLPALVQWVYGDGYVKALEQAMEGRNGKNGVRSSGTS
jgi:hypothetical protein